MGWRALRASRVPRALWFVLGKCVLADAQDEGEKDKPCSWAERWGDIEDTIQARRVEGLKRVGLSSVTHDDIADISMDYQRRRSAEQPASSLHRAAQLASNVHSAAHAKHT